LATKFGANIVLDPWQGALMAQRLRARGLTVEEQAFTAESRRKLFGTLLDLVRTGRLRCQPHEELRRELLGLEVEETASGWRVDHRVGRHDDHVVAVALACSRAAGASLTRPLIFGSGGTFYTVGPDGQDIRPPALPEPELPADLVAAQEK